MQDLIHFCWRERGSTLENPEIDLVTIPGDCTFTPYESDEATAKTNGRIFVLKFSSSSQRYLFWMQSKSKSKSGDPSTLSMRDDKIGQTVNLLLTGEETDDPQRLVSRMVENIRSHDAKDDHNDRPDPSSLTHEDWETNRSGTVDQAMGGTDEDPQAEAGAGGAGADATGGDVREEGEGPREGGADGGRA
jgi:26S proteasome regulatory subunit N13